jgi:hypothetical protein
MITNLEELAAEVVDDPAAYDAGLRAGDNSGPTTSIEGGLVSYVAAINREFVRQFARQIAGLDTGDWLIGQRHIGIGPLSIRGQERQSYGTQESFIEGNSGWKLSPLDASPDPASHFLGWAALGYQYGDGAVAALRITESPTNAGNTTAFTQQDIDSGLAAIALG